MERLGGNEVVRGGHTLNCLKTCCLETRLKSEMLDARGGTRSVPCLTNPRWRLLSVQLSPGGIEQPGYEFCIVLLVRDPLKPLVRSERR